MLTYRTDHAMSDLAEFLARELEGSSYRDLEAKTGVSRGSLENLITRQNKKLPELETLEKLAKAYGFPLWRVIEMAGPALGDEERYSRLARELQISPWLVERFDVLISVSKEEFDELMDYLAFRRRQRGLLPPDADQSNP